jgi:hypothetical protein
MEKVTRFLTVPGPGAPLLFPRVRAIADLLSQTMIVATAENFNRF